MDIFNPETIKEMRDVLRIQGTEPLPPLSLVANVNPKNTRKINICRRQTLTNGTTATIYSVPTDRRFYLTNVSLSMIKDATATTTTVSVIGTIKGETETRILDFVGLTLTAQNQVATLNFAFPCEMEPGTTIRVISATNVGNISANSVVHGILLPDMKD